jgi:hypothetical protein
MFELNLKQLQYESDTWKRLLEFMMEENVYLKNRLSEILMDNFAESLLADAENFLNRFIKEDDIIALLRHEVAELDKLLTRDVAKDGLQKKETLKKTGRLRNNISVAEQQFKKLKIDFNTYVSAIA